jgi:hypothetical protein
MENTNEGREIAHRVAEQWVRETDLIPVSHLALDVDEPLESWESFFAARNIPVVDDDLGRPSVARDVLGDLIAEQREREARVLERPEPDRAPVGVGVPALDESASAFESMMAAGRVSPQQEFGGRPRPNFLQEALEEGARQRAAEREAVRRRKGTR